MSMPMDPKRLDAMRHIVANRITLAQTEAGHQALADLLADRDYWEQKAREAREWQVDPSAPPCESCGAPSTGTADLGRQVYVCGTVCLDKLAKADPDCPMCEGQPPVIVDGVTQCCEGCVPDDLDARLVVYTLRPYDIRESDAPPAPSTEQAIAIVRQAELTESDHRALTRYVQKQEVQLGPAAARVGLAAVLSVQLDIADADADALVARYSFGPMFDALADEPDDDGRCVRCEGEGWLMEDANGVEHPAIEGEGQYECACVLMGDPDGDDGTSSRDSSS